MAKPNPRLSVTVTPGLHATLKRMSELTNNSQSSIVAELLEESHPIFEKMLLVMEAAQRAQAETKERIGNDLAKTHQALEKQLGLMLEHFTEDTDDMVKTIEEVTRRPAKKVAAKGRRAAPDVRSARAPKAAVRPPLLTGGSGIGPKKGKSRASTRSPGR
jgi:hypothetical protein